MRIVFNDKTRTFSAAPAVQFLYRRWTTKGGVQLKDIPKLWDIVEKYAELSEIKGFGTDWTDRDFLYGIAFPGTVSDKALSEAKRVFPDIKLDKAYVLPSKWQLVRKGDLSDMGEMYQEIWSKGDLKNELEEYPEKGKCIIKVNYEN